MPAPFYSLKFRGTFPGTVSISGRIEEAFQRGVDTAPVFALLDSRDPVGDLALGDVAGGSTFTIAFDGTAGLPGFLKFVGDGGDQGRFTVTEVATADGMSAEFAVPAAFDVVDPVVYLPPEGTVTVTFAVSAGVGAVSLPFDVVDASGEVVDTVNVTANVTT